MKKGNTPPSWKRIPIGDLVAEVKTWNPSHSNSEDEFTYIDIGAVDQELKEVTNPRALPCSDAPSRARQIISSRDILVSTVRPNLNAVAIVPESFQGAIASTGFCVLRAQENLINPIFLFHWVKSPLFIEDMIRKATGASYPAVSDRIILESKITLPPFPSSAASPRSWTRPNRCEPSAVPPWPSWTRWPNPSSWRCLGIPSAIQSIGQS